MDFGELINLLPLWALFLLTLAICQAAVEGGTILAISARRRNEPEPSAPLGSLVGAMLALLAFILAFTFGMTASRFDARKQLVLAEANAIGTTYLRADLLPPSQGLEIRRLLREYADLRVHVKTENLSEMLSKSEETHTLLWAQTKSLAAESVDSELRALFVISLNELIDLHQSRKTVALQYRIPGIIWLVVFLLSVLSMLALGYQIGMSGTRRLQTTPVLVAAFSIVIMLIAAIERPEGIVSVSQQPLADVLETMQHDSP